MRFKLAMRFKLNKAKRFAKQQRSNVINALACIYCYFLRAELNGYYQRKEELHRSVVSSGGTAVKIPRVLFRNGLSLTQGSIWRHFFGRRVSSYLT